MSSCYSCWFSVCYREQYNNFATSEKKRAREREKNLPQVFDYEKLVILHGISKEADAKLSRRFDSLLISPSPPSKKRKKKKSLRLYLNFNLNGNSCLEH